MTARRVAGSRLWVVSEKKACKGWKAKSPNFQFVNYGSIWFDMVHPPDGWKPWNRGHRGHPSPKLRISPNHRARLDLTRSWATVKWCGWLRWIGDGVGVDTDRWYLLNNGLIRLIGSTLKFSAYGVFFPHREYQIPRMLQCRFVNLRRTSQAMNPNEPHAMECAIDDGRIRIETLNHPTERLQMWERGSIRTTHKHAHALIYISLLGTSTTKMQDKLPDCVQVKQNELCVS